MLNELKTILNEDKELSKSDMKIVQKAVLKHLKSLSKISWSGTGMSSDSLTFTGSNLSEWEEALSGAFKLYLDVDFDNYDEDDDTFDGDITLFKGKRDSDSMGRISYNFQSKKVSFYN